MCSGLTSVTIPNSITSIGKSVFSSCKGLTSVTIPNSVTNIGGHAFSGCIGLTSVTIPESVTSIGISAFSSCTGLISATIGRGVSYIGDGAFFYCGALSSITCLAVTPPVCGSNVFYEVNRDGCTLKVPTESEDAYKNADTWKEFLTIEGTVTGISNAINNKVNTNVITYDLNGVRLPEPQKGVNIINGKKIVVK